jgi:hypothetical protein
MNIDHDLQKHSREFATALRNHQYEMTDEGGVLFPKQSAIVSGVYTHNVNGADERIDSNIVVTEGMNHMLAVALDSTTSKLNTWYFGLFSANVTPVATWTAANFTANATEITSNTEGYSETTRQEFVDAAPSSGSINNTASKAAFTIATATSISVWGAGLLSSSTKGGTSGTLLSSAKFSAVRTLYATDVFNLGYTLTLTSS